jgi:hypothetical protein
VTDFHDEHDRFTVTNVDRNEYRRWLAELEDWERDAFTRAVDEDRHYYVLDFSNRGGLVMPIILRLTYADDTTDMLRIPAEIWRRTPDAVSKLIVTDKQLVEVVVDPRWETADVDIENNHYPRRIVPSRIEAFKDEDDDGFAERDLMQDMKAEPEPVDPPDDGEGER